MKTLTVNRVWRRGKPSIFAAPSPPPPPVVFLGRVPRVLYSTAWCAQYSVSLAPFFEPLFTHFIASPPAPLHIRANSPKPPPRPAIQLAVSPPLPPPPPQSHYSSSPPIGRSVALPRWWKRRIYSPRTEVGKREDRPAAVRRRRRGQKSANEAEAETRNCFYSGSGFWAGGGIKKEGVYSAVARRAGGGDSGPVLVVFFLRRQTTVFLGGP